MVYAGQFGVLTGQNIERESVCQSTVAGTALHVWSVTLTPLMALSNMSNVMLMSLPGASVYGHFAG